jgi:outer membrane PBP1 activator LpoA protein
MLHALLRGRQVPPLLAALLAAALLCVAVPRVAPAEDSTAAEQAALLARSGQHAEAGRRYEQAARRGFFSWDARLALLAAREYALARQYNDAERMLGKAEGRARGDDQVLLAGIEAEIALAKSDPQRALAALNTIPEPWPAPMAADLLEMRGYAEIAAGRSLDGVRSYVERGRVLGAADARAANDRKLAEALAKYPPSGGAAANATDSERGWLELGQLQAAAAGTAPAIVAQHSAEWRQRHPGHPGTAYLPQATSSAAGVAPGIAAAVPGAAPGSSAPVIALLLPLTGKQQAAGAAVRDGILAAWFDAPPATRPKIEVYDSAGGALAAYQRAIAEGAAVVIGPLTREDVTAVAAQPLAVPTLALNAAAPGTAIPFLFQFSLDPELEARAVARRIAADGLVRGIALFPRSPWGQRLEAAFTAELQATGTTALMASQYYEPGAKDFSDSLRLALGRYGGAGDRPSDKSKPAAHRDAGAEAASGPQFAFVAATPQTARALRPQLRFQMTYDLPIYSTSDAWDPSVKAAADMEGLVFPEMPWILFAGQGAPQLWETVNTTWSRTARGRLRLYAFGYDAYRIAASVRENVRTIGLAGLTGQIEIGQDGKVQRDLQFARIEGGRPQPLGATVPPLPAPAAGDGTP